jgi:hypothetical protein
MSKRNNQMTLLERLRRASAFRGLFIVAALLASQSSLACGLEGVFAPQQIVLIADSAASAEGVGDECCTLCFDCAYCGGCCGVAVSQRASTSPLSPATIAYANIGFATAAPKLWTPPTLLRPPIQAA